MRPRKLSILFCNAQNYRIDAVHPGSLCHFTVFFTQSRYIIFRSISRSTLSKSGTPTLIPGIAEK